MKRAVISIHKQKSFNTLVTESRSRYTDLDTYDVETTLRVMNEEDGNVITAVREQIPNIKRAVDVIVRAFRRGGRLFYVGAGTSGRIGILDASEASPTFGVDHTMIQGMIAGGDEAIRKPSEDAEDRAEDGSADVKQANVTADDVVVGISASGRTPYVVGALKQANVVGAKTVAVVCNPHSSMHDVADIVIAPVVGPEVLLGSTRMKAGTAQKLVLNMLSTTSMIQIGKVYSNLMVDVKATNDKLVHRAIHMIMLATDCERGQAEHAFYAADRHVKTAIVMVLTGMSKQEAKARLHHAEGFVRRAVEGRTHKINNNE